jgi:hypothetical protein
MCSNAANVAEIADYRENRPIPGRFSPDHLSEERHDSIASVNLSDEATREA